MQTVLVQSQLLIQPRPMELAWFDLPPALPASHYLLALIQSAPSLLAEAEAVVLVATAAVAVQVRLFIQQVELLLQVAQQSQRQLAVAVHLPLVMPIRQIKLSGDRELVAPLPR
jgi:hypothetical protein